MTAPNTLSITTVNAKTALGTLTTVTSNVIVNGASSNAVVKVNTIMVNNYSASAILANVFITRSSVPYYIAGNVSVPAYSTLFVLGKDSATYLEEGDYLQANVSSNVAQISSSYELIS